MMLPVRENLCSVLETDIFRTAQLQQLFLQTSSSQKHGVETVI
jgi:hypothetical protein